MELAHGGHLTHGSPVNVSGMWFHFIGYQVDRETEQLDMDRVRELAKEHRPKIILSGYTAYAREIDFAAFREIADEVGALLWVDASHFIGLVAGGAYPSPVPHADVVTFTTHKALRGPRGAMIVCKEEHAKAIDKAVFPMMQGGPLEHCIAAKAVALKEAMTPEFRDYAHRVVRDARTLAAGLADEGLRVISGGTDSHLILADVRPVGTDGKAAEAVCDEVGIALNKNQIPYDPNPPSAPSGIRVGTPGPATLGMDEEEMGEIASIIGDVLKNPDDGGTKAKSGQRVRRSDGAVPGLRVVSALQTERRGGGCRTATAPADCGNRGRLPDRLPHRSGRHVRSDTLRSDGSRCGSGRSISHRIGSCTWFRPRRWAVWRCGPDSSWRWGSLGSCRSSTR